MADYDRDRDRDRYRDRGDTNYFRESYGPQDRGQDRGGRGDYRSDDDRWARGSGHADRTWPERAGDEVGSWFGSDDAERRRRMDQQRMGRYPGDDRGENAARDVGNRMRYGGDDDRMTYRSYRNDDDNVHYRGGMGGGRGDDRGGRGDDRMVRGSGQGDRTWVERAGDEVASWFGADEAERRRQMDQQRLGRYPGDDRGENAARGGGDDRYRSWGSNSPGGRNDRDDDDYRLRGYGYRQDRQRNDRF